VWKRNEHVKLIQVVNEVFKEFWVNVFILALKGLCRKVSDMQKQKKTANH